MTTFSTNVILNALPDPVFLKDKNHTWLFVNQAFANLVGHPIEELLGKNDADYMPEETCKIFWREDDMVLASGLESHIEEDLPTPVGTIRKLLTRKSRIQHEGEYYVFGIIRDVTEVSRHARLAHLGQLAASLSHELMTPLTVMDHHCRKSEDIMRERSLTVEESTKFITAMSRTRDRLMTTIQGVKSLARDGKELSKSDTTLHELVEDARELSAPRLIQRGAVLIIGTLPAIPLHVRSTHITQILINLIHNAADAVENLPEKWVKLEANCTPTHLNILVTDAGKGITPEIALRLMTPFFTTKHAAEGMGLGLSLAAKMAAEHGGELSLESDCPNTCFRLRLPLFA